MEVYQVPVGVLVHEEVEVNVPVGARVKVWQGVSVNTGGVGSMEEVKVLVGEKVTVGVAVPVVVDVVVPVEVGVKVPVKTTEIVEVTVEVKEGTGGNKGVVGPPMCAPQPIINISPNRIATTMENRVLKYIGTPEIYVLLLLLYYRRDKWETLRRNLNGSIEIG